MNVWLRRVKNLVDDLVARVLQHVDFGGGARQPRVAAPDAFQQQARCFRDDLHLFEKEVVKLLFAWQQSHKVGLDMERPHGNRYSQVRVNRRAITVRVTIGNNSSGASAASRIAVQVEVARVQQTRRYPRCPWRKACSP